MMERRYRIGVMQGRLLPKYQGRFQAHPLGYWQQEFPIAATLGLGGIEFILDFEDAARNPLLREGGINEIRRVSEVNGLAVWSVCADYFMIAPLHSLDANVAQQSESILRQLIASCSDLGVGEIVIPCVDSSSLIGRPSETMRLAERLTGFIPLVERLRVNLSLETDLPPQEFAALLEQLPSKRITANYDIGNSASLGYDPQDELECYGARISDLHIKDRTYRGGSVILGTGDANFDRFSAAFAKLKYKGVIIFQAYRDDEGVSVFRQQYEWARRNLPWIFAESDGAS